MSAWPDTEGVPHRPPRAKEPTRTWVRQWGVRYSTGREVWYRVDLTYGNRMGGGNGASRDEVVKAVEERVASARSVGVELTYKVLYRDHLTTTWSRWTSVKEEG
jgi:hypothetical protein